MHMFRWILSVIYRLKCAAELVAHILDPRLRAAHARSVLARAEKLIVSYMREKVTWDAITVLLGSYGNAFSPLFATALASASVLALLADFPIQTLLLFESYAMPAVWAAVAAVILIAALSGIAARSIRAAALSSTMFHPWLRRSVWMSGALAVACAISGAALLYVRWLPADALVAWNSAARYARWIFTESLPLLGGTLAAAAWLVGIRRHATEKVEALDDDLKELTMIADAMRAFVTEGGDAPDTSSGNNDDAVGDDTPDASSGHNGGAVVQPFAGKVEEATHAS